MDRRCVSGFLREEPVSIPRRRLRKDGTQCWAIVSASAIYDAAGTLSGFGAITTEPPEGVPAQ